MTTRANVVIGLLGTTLDGGADALRWEKWRPSVSLCQHEDLLIERFELLYESRYRRLAQQVADDIAHCSPETAVRLNEIRFDDAWDFEKVYGALHDFARAYVFNPENEAYLIHITTGTHVAQICMFLLTESRHFPARLIQTSPPDRRKKKEPGRYEIIDLDLSKYDRLASRFQQEKREAASFLKSGIETRNKQFNALIERVEQVAIHSRDPLLLMGPTGAGKSQLARRIYELKKSRHQVTGEFVEVNCATVRGDSAMSALFGHVKGAFTGAAGARAGHLRAANEGVLFLDEIGTLGQDEQAMLLRALEEKRFYPLGGDREVHSEFQLVAGTNSDLHAGVREGRFREDLLARINLWTFRLPGLAERLEDIEPNLEYELDKFARRTGRRVSFSREAQASFLKFARSSEARWSGNFRDLNAAVTRMATLAQGGRISVELVDEEIARLREQWIGGSEPGGGALLSTLLDPERLQELDHFDRLQLEQVIALCRDSRSLSEAGRQLFGASRGRKSTVNDADRLRKYLARFGLEWQQVKGIGQ